MLLFYNDNLQAIVCPSMVCMLVADFIMTSFLFRKSLP